MVDVFEAIVIAFVNVSDDVDRFDCSPNDWFEVFVPLEGDCVANIMILCAEAELWLGLLTDVSEIGVDSVCESDLGLVVVGDFDGGDSLAFSVDLFMSVVSDEVVAIWSLGFVLQIVAK